MAFTVLKNFNTTQLYNNVIYFPLFTPAESVSIKKYKKFEVHVNKEKTQYSYVMTVLCCFVPYYLGPFSPNIIDYNDLQTSERLVKKNVHRLIFGLPNILKNLNKPKSRITIIPALAYEEYTCIYQNVLVKLWTYFISKSVNSIDDINALWFFFWQRTLFLIKIWIYLL